MNQSFFDVEVYVRRISDNVAKVFSGKTFLMLIRTKKKNQDSYISGKIVCSRNVRFNMTKTGNYAQMRTVCRYKKNFNLRKFYKCKKD